MLQLTQGHYVKRIEQREKSKTHTYEIVSAEEYHQLQNRITTVLDEIMERLKTVQGFKQVQMNNELSKASKNGKHKRSPKSSEGDNADQKENNIVT